MTLFLGGPYHGKDLPIEPMAEMIRLPREDELDGFLGLTESDPEATGKHDWPFLYQLDKATDRSFYRFVSGQSL